MRRLALLLIICIFTISLFSCQDANEVDDLLHVVSLGIDRGVTDKWRITIQTPTLKDGGGGGSGGAGAGSDEYTTITVDAPSFFTGIDMLNASVSRRINFMHTGTLVISEDAAKSGILGEFLAPVARFRQVRRTMHVLISKGSAMEHIQNTKPTIGTALSKNLQILINQSKITGYIPYTNLDDFYYSMKSSYIQPTAIFAAISDASGFKDNGEKFQGEYEYSKSYYAGEIPANIPNRNELFGTAVFDGDMMVGKLNGEETRLFQMARGDFKMGFFTMQDPRQTSVIVPLDVYMSNKPKVKISFEDNKPIIHLGVELEGDLLAVQSGINYEDPKLTPELEVAFEKQIKGGLDKLMEKCKGLKSDIFGFGEVASKQFLTIQEWEKYKWLSHFKDAEITTEVKFAIRRTGTQFRSSPIINSEEKK